MAEGGGGGGGGGEGRVSRWDCFCIQPSSDYFCLMGSPICLLYLVMQDFVQKALFSEIRAIRSRCGNYV